MVFGRGLPVCLVNCLDTVSMIWVMGVDQVRCFTSFERAILAMRGMVFLTSLTLIISYVGGS